MKRIRNWIKSKFIPQIGVEYKYDNDFGGKFSDGSPRKPLKYIPTEIQKGRVFYDVVSSEHGFLYGNSSSLFSFFQCYIKYDEE